jgi:GTPase SAR1 family protein
MIFEKQKRNERIPIVLCGNKCDIDDKRVISKEVGEEFAKKYNSLFFETSAKTNINIEDTFLGLVRSVNSGAQISKTKKSNHIVCDLFYN